jgi:hypothetical protein
VLIARSGADRVPIRGFNRACTLLNVASALTETWPSG